MVDHGVTKITLTPPLGYVHFQPIVIIKLVTVFDAILTSRQTRKKITVFV